MSKKKRISFKLIIKKIIQLPLLKRGALLLSNLINQVNLRKNYERARLQQLMKKNKKNIKRNNAQARNVINENIQVRTVYKTSFDLLSNIAQFIRQTQIVIKGMISYLIVKKVQDNKIILEVSSPEEDFAHHKINKESLKVAALNINILKEINDQITADSPHLRSFVDSLQSKHSSRNKSI